MLIVDEAHSLPPATKEQVIEIASLASNRDRVLQFLLAGQPALGGAPMLPSLADDRLSVRARLLPLERDECERYIIHRLAIAGGNAVTFSPPAHRGDLRAVRRRAAAGQPAVRARAAGSRRAEVHRIEPTMIESAASALDLIRLRPKRFRWYGTR